MTRRLIMEQHNNCIGLVRNADVAGLPSLAQQATPHPLRRQNCSRFTPGHSLRRWSNGRQTVQMESRVESGAEATFWLVAESGMNDHDLEAFSRSLLAHVSELQIDTCNSRSSQWPLVLHITCRALYKCPHQTPRLSSSQRRPPTPPTSTPLRHVPRIIPVVAGHGRPRALWRVGCLRRAQG